MPKIRRRIPREYRSLIEDFLNHAHKPLAEKMQRPELFETNNAGRAQKNQAHHFRSKAFGVCNRNVRAD